MVYRAEDREGVGEGEGVLNSISSIISWLLCIFQALSFLQGTILVTNLPVNKVGNSHCSISDKELNINIFLAFVTVVFNFLAMHL